MPRSATASPRSSARGWATRTRSPCSSRGRALAYERSELVADETAARVAALAAWRVGSGAVLVASVQALLQHTIDPADLPTSRGARPAARIAPTRSSASCSTSATCRSLEVAGRGEFARRGGIVDVFPPTSRCRSGSSSSATRSTRSGGSIRPTSGRSARSPAPRSCRRASSCCPAAASRSCVRRLGRAAARLPERLAADLARFEGQTRRRGHGGRRSGGPVHARPRRRRRGRGLGDDRLPRPPPSITSTRERSSSSTSLATSPRPPTFLWRQADERRADLIAAGDLPKDWPSTYLAAARLEVAPARRREPSSSPGSPSPATPSPAAA